MAKAPSAAVPENPLPKSSVTIEVFLPPPQHSTPPSPQRQPPHSSNNVLQQVAQGDPAALSKSTCNGLGWATGTDRGYNPSATSYNQATGASTDVILTQVIPSCDAAGNVISQARLRFGFVVIVMLLLHLVQSRDGVYQLPKMDH